MSKIIGNVVIQKRNLISLGLLKEYDIPVNDGDIFQVQLDEGKVVLVPMKLIPADQAWFWSENWQEGEREAEADLVAERVATFDHADDLIKDLDS
jgi:hypothetical protein